MKIYLYGVREDEKGYIKEWEKEHKDIDIELYT